MGSWEVGENSVDSGDPGTAHATVHSFFAVIVAWALCWAWSCWLRVCGSVRLRGGHLAAAFIMTSDTLGVSRSVGSI